MSKAAAQAQAHARQRAPSRTRRDVRLPGEDLTLAETLRVMDVAREMRQQRETAEEMFRRDDVRIRLRDKLMHTARISGDSVTEDEIDAAIEQYMETVHAYQDPPGGWKTMLAHGWIWRGRIAAGLTALAAAGGLWFLLA